ncbi:hypothetical protein [Carboxylicivirga caseinilyticus]|uniref:hypothetical protein n=1 Tax=Carboxylicivirga caseinilyticus TaxID=3417572 RepID=UPI003D34BEEA|nr:hypothetical protein [Marinilabiliaceae bacterium A049]
MKKSWILILSIAIVIGLTAYGIIDSLTKKQIAEIESNTNYKIEQLKIYSEMLNVKPQTYLLEDETIIQIPNFNFTYDNNKLDIKYDFARYENGKLIRVDLVNGNEN